MSRILLSEEHKLHQSTKVNKTGTLEPSNSYLNEFLCINCNLYYKDFIELIPSVSTIDYESGYYEFEKAAMVKSVDTLLLGSSARASRFESELRQAFFLKRYNKFYNEFNSRFLFQ
nr:ribosomal protein S15 [Sanicula orthacantha var. stolonifera]